MLEEVQKEFESKISEKNSWGKNEIIRIHKDSMLKVTLNNLNDK